MSQPIRPLTTFSTLHPQDCKSNDASPSDHNPNNPPDHSLCRQSKCPHYVCKAWKHWIDADRDCQNTRSEELIEGSLTPVTFKTDKGCRVVSGNWLSAYSGDVFTDASKLDIDHLVPLKEAQQAGGHAWDAARRRDYANDLGDPNTLIAVDRGLNMQKGAGDVSEWLPPHQAYQTEYAQAWVAVKLKWGLTADAREIAALQAILGTEAEMPMLAEECAGTMSSEELPAPGRLSGKTLLYPDEDL